MCTGALLGPGLLLVPGLAAKTAGPASTLAWLTLLGASALLAMVFGALGRKAPAANGVAGYAQGRPRPGGGGLTRTWFLAGVVTGAPESRIRRREGIDT
jgi:amino acid efflux transporter